jgi:hypothetical protein
MIALYTLGTEVKTRIREAKPKLPDLRNATARICLRDGWTGLVFSAFLKSKCNRMIDLLPHEQKGTLVEFFKGQHEPITRQRHFGPTPRIFFSEMAGDVKFAE